MCSFYYDEENNVAYKVAPVQASAIQGEENDIIMVRTDVKITNLRKEKIRRTLAELYSATEYDMESAKDEFINSRLMQFVGEARQIHAEEYEILKTKYEAV